MIAKIYYSVMPNPSEDKWWADNVYWKIHYNDDDSPISIPKAKFVNYWRLMNSYKVEGGVDTALNKLFAIFNDADHIANPNPLGTAKGQEKVRSSGTHHTSMSVADVIQIKSDYYIVAGTGFKKLILR